LRRLLDKERFFFTHCKTITPINNNLMSRQDVVLSRVRERESGSEFIEKNNH